MSEQVAVGRCRDCYWWRSGRPDPNGSAYGALFFDRGHRPTAEEDTGACLLTVTGYYAVEGVPESLASAYDHEDYAAELWTKADFGCVQFKHESEG